MADRISLNELNFNYQSLAKAADVDHDGNITAAEARAYANKLRIEAGSATDENVREAIEAKVVEANKFASVVEAKLASLAYAEDPDVERALAVAQELAKSMATDTRFGTKTVLADSLKDKGIPEAQQLDVIRLANALANGPGNGDRPYQLQNALSLGSAAFDGELSESETKDINDTVDRLEKQVPELRHEQFGQPQIAKAIALAEAQRLAQSNREVVRAERAFGITPPARGSDRVSAVQDAALEQAKAMHAWRLTAGGEASVIADKIVPLITSADANERARGNLILQSLSATSYSYYYKDRGWDGWGLFEGSTHHVKGDTGALSSASTRQALAATIVKRLSAQQLKALEPATVAGLMIDLHSGWNAYSRRSNEDYGSISYSWRFASSGNFDLPTSGRTWSLRGERPKKAAAVEAVSKLLLNPPKGVTFNFGGDGNLASIAYTPSL